MNLKHYEIILILNPVLSKEQLDEVIKSFKEKITSLEGEIEHEENWGVKNLAYPINHKTKGYYQLFELKGPGTIVDKIEITFKRDERVMRFLTVSLDKHGIEFNERRRRGEFNKPKKEIINESI